MPMQKKEAIFEILATLLFKIMAGSVS